MEYGLCKKLVFLLYECHYENSGELDKDLCDVIHQLKDDDWYDEEIVEIVKKRNFPTILTPHNKEMARLCKVSTKEVENERFNISKEKAKELNSYVVLKGPHTVVSTPFGEQFVNFSGNSGLAKGGSGDVLTGIIASFVARFENVQHAVSNAVFVHGKVCDVLINKSEKI